MEAAPLTLEGVLLMMSLLAHVTPNEYPMGLTLFLGGLGVGVGIGIGAGVVRYFRLR